MLSFITPILTDLNRKYCSFIQKITPEDAGLRKLLSVVLFLVLLHGFYSYVGVYRYIHERPCSIHSSAQCERASVALNYYRGDMNFFEPRIQRFNKDDGISGIEFPVVYYSAALLYKLFGFNELYLRVISLLIISAGFLLFYLLARKILKSDLLSLAITGSALFSPVLLYYSANFMPDAPGLGFTLCSWYFFFKYIGSQRQKHLVLFIVFGTLGALIKIVSLLCFFVVIGLLILDRLKFFRNSGRVYVFKNAWKLLTGIGIGMTAVFCWYAYARWLSKYHGNESFALQPMLVDSIEALKIVAHYVSDSWVFQYYSPETYVLLITAVLVILVRLKQTDRLLLSITGLYLLGSLFYAYLFLYQFSHHDYYIIAMLPFSFFLLLTAGDKIRRVSGGINRWVIAILVLVLFFNIRGSLSNCRENYAFRYDNKEYFGGDFRAYYDLEPRLRALGLTRKDLVVSAFDASYSNSLYFMNQPGYTVEYYFERDTIQQDLSRPGVTYLIVNDSAKFNKIFPNHFEKNIALIHRGLIVYKLKKKQERAGR